MENKLKHLEFIQNVITRMNSNSFVIKGWTITIVSAVLAIFATIQIDYILLIGVIPIVLFWFLDAYYLTQEKLFRCLYNKTIQENSVIPLFNMEIPEECKNKSDNSYCSVFFSKTIWPLYLSILIIVIIGFFSFRSFNGISKKTNLIQIEMKDTIKIKNIAPLTIKVELNGKENIYFIQVCRL